MTILGDPLIRFVDSNVSCIDNIDLQSGDNNIVSNFQIFRASESISIQDYVLPTGGVVELDAPSVNIESNFICPQGAVVEITSEGCSNNAY